MIQQGSNLYRQCHFLRMRWLILSIACLFLFPFFISGQVVSISEARQFAEKIFAQIAANKGQKGDLYLEDSVITSKDQEPAVFIIYEKKGGFLILSAEKKTFPLLGWADAGSFSEDMSEWPPSLTEIVNSWVEQIDYVRKYNLAPSPEINEMWNILKEDETFGFFNSKDVIPLLQTTWNQGCGYNALCPVDTKGPCGRVYTGCVATAMAQVIRYNEHPLTGMGSRCYITGSYGELCADFSTAVYDYSGMSNTSGNAAVALLMYHCGVAVSMSYGPSGSSAYSASVASAMRTNFDYTNGLIIGKGAYPEESWVRILKRELDNNRPLYYSGHGTSGHAFVLDGYKPTDHFHVNWGWGGSYNGYFYLNSLNPGSMNFTSSQQAIVGMIPTSDFAGLDFSQATDLLCKTPVDGDLSAGTDYVNYYKNTYPAAIGRELVYRFNTTTPGRINIKISNQEQSVYVFLLNQANKDSLINYGSNGLIVDNTLPGTYYIVVEGVGGDEPAFTIEAVCPTNEADLDIRSASVIPRYVQSLQGNVSLSSTVKNIGNLPAASCTMEYYLSSDPKFDYGTDTFIGSGSIPALNIGQSEIVNSVISMPGDLLPGDYYVIFVADRENAVPETDDENNQTAYVTVPEDGLLDCSSAVNLFDGEWYNGNTLTDGDNILEEYSMGGEMTGPEVVHTFTPLFNGLINITFVEKSPGMLYAMVIPVCNENTVETSMRIYNLTDTIVNGQFYGIAGNQYFIVVDGQKESSGDYSLLVELPQECPQIKVEYWGDTNLCDGDHWPVFSTFWGHNNYQWKKDGLSIAGATSSYFTPSLPGTYHVEIMENGCAGSSSPLIIRMDNRPDTALIGSLDDTTFCYGSSVELILVNNVSYPVKWARNGEFIENETGNTVSVDETGNYSLYTINGACRIMSANKIEVNVLDPPVDIGKPVPLPSDSLEFYYPFTLEDFKTGGDINSIVGWDYEPVDDRFGNFWEARYLKGESEKMYSSNYRRIPEDFTLTLWFKTGTIKGGLITGFFDNPWGPAMMDCILYMSDNGKLHFWLSNGAANTELESSGIYNDNNWHCVLIQHKGIMTMEIDDGEEVINSSSAVIKENFKGYWTFGGPAIPSGVLAMPTSMFFNGAFDDLTCVNEASEYIDPYMVGHPIFKILSDPLPVCVPGTVSFDIPFSQKGVQYSVWNSSNSSWAPLSSIGTGGTVRIGDAKIALGINEFLIVAKNLTSGCDIMLDTVFTFEVQSVCTVIPENLSENKLKVFPIPVSDILYFESSVILKELKIFNIHGSLVHSSLPGKADLEINLQGLPEGVYYYIVITDDNLLIRGKIIVI